MLGGPDPSDEIRAARKNLAMMMDYIERLERERDALQARIDRALALLTYEDVNPLWMPDVELAAHEAVEVLRGEEVE